MKVCFVGCGSIGKRHINNLKTICEKKKIELVIHLLRSSSKTCDVVVDKQCFSISELDDKYDIVFITNPTFLHFQTLKSLINHSDSFFVEKPVFDRVDLDSSFIPEGKKIYVACPLRYTGAMQKLKEIIDLKEVFSVRAICSTYLPDWRPGTDYRHCYSAHKDEGGGVRIDLIHEWDYLTDLFGFPEEVSAISGKYSKLEIDSEDVAIYIGKYSDKVIELHLDYFGRVPRRKCELYTSDYVYELDIINNIVNCDGEILYNQSEDSNDKYIRELEHFLDYCEERTENGNDIDNALKVMKLAYSQ